MDHRLGRARTLSQFNNHQLLTFMVTLPHKPWQDFWHRKRHWVNFLYLWPISLEGARHEF